MPKIVDHARRRRDLIRATLRIIARKGLTGARMRDVAAEAGYANGAIKPYFKTKAELLSATYVYVFDSTNERVNRSTYGLSGLEALQAFAHEVLPVSGDLQEEARVVLAFWGEVAQDDEHARITQESMEQWRRQIKAWLEQARSTSEVSGGVDAATEADILLTYMMGAQVMSITEGLRFDGAAFESQLSYLMRRLATA